MNVKNPWNEVARLYDETRPPYPDQLIDDIISGAQLSPGSHLLEIGAGTGKATVMLADRGFRVHCVEPGRNLADILLEKCSDYPGVSVDITSFEEWTPRNTSQFDLVYSAQAFNWVDPGVRYQKSHQLLREDGYLALFWYQPSSTNPQLVDEIDAVTRQYVHEACGNGGSAGNGMVPSWESDIASSGLFHSPQVFEYQDESVLTARSYVKTLQSQSSIASLDEDAKARISDEIIPIINRNGGSVTTLLNYKMYLAKRRTTNA